MGWIKRGGMGRVVETSDDEEYFLADAIPTKTAAAHCSLDSLLGFG